MFLTQVPQLVNVVDSTLRSSQKLRHEINDTKVQETDFAERHCILPALSIRGIGCRWTVTQALQKTEVALQPCWCCQNYPYYDTASAEKLLSVWAGSEEKQRWNLTACNRKPSLKHPPPWMDASQAGRKESTTPLCLSLVCIFHHQREDKSSLVLLWGSSDSLMSWFSSLTWQGTTLFFFFFHLFGICCVCFLEPDEGKQWQHVCVGGTALPLSAAKFLDQPVKSYPAFQRYCRA